MEAVGEAPFCIQFGPTKYEEFNEALCWVRLSRTVRENQTHFERLANHVNGWSEKALVGCFNGGLKATL